MLQRYSPPPPTRTTRQPALSRGFREILKFCAQTRGPFSEHDLKAVHAIYRCVKRDLSSQELAWTLAILSRLNQANSPLP